MHGCSPQRPIASSEGGRCVRVVILTRRACSRACTSAPMDAGVLPTRSAGSADYVVMDDGWPASARGNAGAATRLRRGKEGPAGRGFALDLNGDPNRHRLAGIECQSAGLRASPACRQRARCSGGYDSGSPEPEAPGVGWQASLQTDVPSEPRASRHARASAALSARQRRGSPAEAGRANQRRAGSRALRASDA